MPDDLCTIFSHPNLKGFVKLTVKTGQMQPNKLQNAFKDKCGRFTGIYRQNMTETENNIMYVCVCVVSTVWVCGLG